MFTIKPKVFLLVHCQDPANTDTALLTFRTLRVGFPTSEVVVFDNVSVIGDQVRQRCEETGAQYVGFPHAITQEDFLRRVLMRESSVVLADPDLIFWEKVEDWDFSAHLLAGRLIPPFQDEFTHCHSVKRLHTSLLWLPDIAQMRQKYQVLAPRGHDPVAELTVLIGGQWIRWDPMAGLFHLFRERAHCFGERELSAYDHLFCGTQREQAIQVLGNNSPVAEAARLVQRDPALLKGFWRQQQAYFEARHSAVAEQLLP